MQLILQCLSLKHFRAGLVSSPWVACLEKRHRGSLCCRTWGLSQGSNPGVEELPHQRLEVGNINIKHGYKWVLCTENIISQGTGVMATCPLVGSQWLSPATKEGGEEGTGEVLVLPSKRGFTPQLPPNAPRGVFPGWMVLFLGGVTDPMGAAVSLGCLGAGFGQEGGA